MCYMDGNVALPLWSRLKYVNNCWRDCQEYCVQTFIKILALLLLAFFHGDISIYLKALLCLSLPHRAAYPAVDSQSCQNLHVLFALTHWIKILNHKPKKTFCKSTNKQITREQREDFVAPHHSAMLKYSLYPLVLSCGSSYRASKGKRERERMKKEALN